jgi:hypothetical protein
MVAGPPKMILLHALGITMLPQVHGSPKLPLRKLQYFSDDGARKAPWRGGREACHGPVTCCFFLTIHALLLGSIGFSVLY